MTDYKLVPVEPTPEMLQVACDEEQRPLPMWSRMRAIYTAMLAAAPAVQGGPVAWVHPEQLNALKKAKDTSATCSVWNVPGAMPSGTSLRVPLYAAPQPAPDVKALVEALEAAQKEAVRGINHARNGAQAAAALGRVSSICGAALAAHREQGGGQ